MLFASDLDNTLIHSYKTAGAEDVCVEVRDGKKLSFMPRSSYSLLKKISAMCTFVPVTTRSLEQYRRIDLGFTPMYAVVANGALLIKDGEADEAWTAETRRTLNTSLPALEANGFLYDIRYVDDFFIFAKSDCPPRSAEYLRAITDEKRFRVHAVNNKVYLFPIGLDKGAAVKRLKKRLDARTLICAGDSEIDIPMLEFADTAIYPRTLGLRRENACILDGETFTSEAPRAAMRLIMETMSATHSVACAERPDPHPAKTPTSHAVSR